MASLQKLIRVLNQIYSMQKEMLDLAEDKKQILIKGDIDELSKLMDEEALWLKKFKLLDSEREAEFNNLISDKNFDSGIIKLSDFLDQLAPSEDKQELASISDKLVKIHDEIKQTNDVNTQLINQSLQYVSSTIQSIIHGPEESTTYSKTQNNYNAATRSGIYDQKV